MHFPRHYLYISPAKRAQEIKLRLNENLPAVVERQAAAKLAVELSKAVKPLAKLTTIRQETCKAPSTNPPRVIHPCPVATCPKSYKYLAALEKHCLNAHPGAGGRCWRPTA